MKYFFYLIAILCLGSCNKHLLYDQAYQVQNELWLESLSFHGDSTFTYLVYDRNSNEQEVHGFSRGYWTYQNGRIELKTSGELLGANAISTGVLDMTGANVVVKSDRRVILIFEKLHWSKKLKIRSKKDKNTAD